uniref:Secreted protein n=1 Tax=Anguilla anguilla TaxID=7936 RepID=A0A0E9QNE1_ANGAN
MHFICVLVCSSEALVCGAVIGQTYKHTTGRSQQLCSITGLGKFILPRKIILQYEPETS